MLVWILGNGELLSKLFGIIIMLFYCWELKDMGASCILKINHGHLQDSSKI